MRKLALRIVGWLVSRLGGMIVPKQDFQRCLGTIITTQDYVTHSGHLHTVRGRRPRAVERLDSALGEVHEILVQSPAEWVQRLMEGSA